MSIIFPWVSLFVGAFAGAFLVIPPIIIIVFGIPFSNEMKLAGILKSTAPVKRYISSLVVLTSLFAILSWVMWHSFADYLWTYMLGISLTVIPNLRKCGRTDVNVAEFIESNAGDIDRQNLADLANRQSGTAKS
jgi:hypothetical protein